jgi:hypothetical protein
MAASMERDISTSINVKPILVGMVEVRAWAVMAFSIQDDAQFFHLFWVVLKPSLKMRVSLLEHPL